MLNNVWHDGDGKTRARSMLGHEMIRHANAMIDRRTAELAQQYQKYRLFEVTDAFREEMGAFRIKVQEHFGSVGRQTLRINGADVNVPTQGVEITQLDGELLDDRFEGASGFLSMVTIMSRPIGHSSLCSSP